MIQHWQSEWRPTDYMRSQPEINEKMRLILVEWLIDVCVRFELNPETFYLTVNIMDRFLSAKPIPRKELQLVGLSALLMSSKYEEIWPPQVEDLADIADHAYSHKQILVMEKTILSTLEWYLTVPTHYVFLARFIKASIADQRVRDLLLQTLLPWFCQFLKLVLVLCLSDGEHGALSGGVRCNALRHDNNVQPITRCCSCNLRSEISSSPSSRLD